MEAYSSAGRAVGVTDKTLNSLMTTKQPPLPACSGRRNLWMIGRLSQRLKAKRGPLLKSTLMGDAYTHKDVLDNELLQDPAKEVNYFKNTLSIFTDYSASSIIDDRTRSQTRYRNTLPSMTVIAQFFIIQDQLSAGRMTDHCNASLITLKHFSYKMLNLVSRTRTPAQDPSIRPPGGNRSNTFYILEQGEQDHLSCSERSDSFTKDNPSLRFSKHHAKKTHATV